MHDRDYKIMLENAIILLNDINCTNVEEQKDACTIRVASVAITVAGPQMNQDLECIPSVWSYQAQNIDINVTVSTEQFEQRNVFVVGPSEAIGRTGQNADMFKLAAYLRSFKHFQTEECSALILRYILKQKLPSHCRMQY